ncbi:MAG: DUF1127 domain-containing protein [Kiloniellaceae bacterium]
MPERNPSAEIVYRGVAPGRRKSYWQWVAHSLLRGVDCLLIWQERSCERRHLQGLDDRLLKDVGIGRAGAAREAAKGFWRP